MPQADFDRVIEFIEEKSEVFNKYMAETDVTKDYYDKKNIVTNLEIQEQTLRGLFEKA